MEELTDEQFLENLWREKGISLERDRNFEQRQVIQESDYRFESVKIASTLTNENLEQLLDRSETIYQYMMKDKIRRRTPVSLEEAFKKA
jgi:hypothetical protein